MAQSAHAGAYLPADLAPSGEDRFEMIDSLYLLRHGSSADLLQRSSRLLNSKEAGFAKTNVGKEYAIGKHPHDAMALTLEFYKLKFCLF